jgi:hypothetical protein
MEMLRPWVVLLLMFSTTCSIETFEQHREGLASDESTTKASWEGAVRRLQDSSVIFDPATLPKGGIAQRGSSRGKGRKGKPAPASTAAVRGTEKSSLSDDAGIFLLPVSKEILPVPEPWANITMPSKSYFLGFPPPSDPLKWNQAQMQASRGEE